MCRCFRCLASVFTSHIYSRGCVIAAASSRVSPASLCFTVPSYHSGCCCLRLNGRSTNLFCQDSIASFSAALPLMLWLIPFSSHTTNCKRKKGGREGGKEPASEMRLKDTRPEMRAKWVCGGESRLRWATQEVRGDGVTRGQNNCAGQVHFAYITYKIDTSMDVFFYDRHVAKRWKLPWKPLKVSTSHLE